MWNSKTASAEHKTISRDSAPALIIPTQNLVLSSIPRADANEIVSAAKAVNLKTGDMLFEGGEEIDEIYFPINCVVSALTVLEDGSTVENYMTGREGIVGIPALIGGRKALHWMQVSVAGGALRVSARVVEDVSTRSPGVHKAVLRAYRDLFTQICQRSVCNVRHTLLQRLCVWLLMMSDRLNASELPFTQEDIANRISVRRAGVSGAASTLQAMHAISYHRGTIVITDRPAIERAACECYSVLARDFRPESQRLPSSRKIAIR